MTNTILTQTDHEVNTEDFRSLLSQLEAEETFEAAYAAAVGCYYATVAAAGDADWTIIWEAYQKAFGVGAGFFAPAPGFDTAIPDEDLYIWRMATQTGINPF